jgi:hypothetical protein
MWNDVEAKIDLLNFWFFIDSTVNFHSLLQNPVFQID